MIHFIIVEDNIVILKRIILHIEEMFLKMEYQYEIHTFLEYGEDFDKIMHQKLENKIYIFDIEIPNKKNGIEAAEEMRKIDLHSALIFLTMYENFGHRIVKSKLDCFRFISKKDDYLQLLGESIEHLILKLRNSNIILLKDTQKVFVVPLEQILYFTTDTVERKTAVVTEFRTLYINTSLKKLENELPFLFVRTQRACIANIAQVLGYDYKKKSLIFKDRIEPGLLSKTYQEQIEERLKLLENKCKI